MCACVCGIIELAAEFQALLDNCSSSMAKRWLVIQVHCFIFACFTDLGCILFIFIAHVQV